MASSAGHEPAREITMDCSFVPCCGVQRLVTVEFEFPFGVVCKKRKTRYQFNKKLHLYVCLYLQHTAVEPR